jgi:DNA-binding winged helix-turn-helix (wHTH) protein
MARFYTFGPFRLDAGCDTLVGPHGPMALGQRACVLLRTLVSQPGVLVAKSALMDAHGLVWQSRRATSQCRFRLCERHSQTPQAVDNG